MNNCASHSRYFSEDFKALYHLRWQEENSFRDLKYSLCLKAFHSKKYDYIVQEVWARVILYNFSSSIIINVTIDLEEPLPASIGLNFR